MPKTVGIIGGMGPDSTIYLMKKVIELTPVDQEQDHIRMVVDNNPLIPDRTAFLLGRGPSPVPLLIESAKGLEKSGVNFIVMACNTAHAFIAEIQKSVSIPLLDMLELLSGYLSNRYPSGSKFLLFTTTGSLSVSLFQKYFSHFDLILPSSTDQENIIMDLIYGKSGIKKGGKISSNVVRLASLIEKLSAYKPLGIIAGCTEIGIILDNMESNIPIFNPLDILANEIVRRVKGVGY